MLLLLLLAICGWSRSRRCYCYLLDLGLVLKEIGIVYNNLLLLRVMKICRGCRPRKVIVSCPIRLMLRDRVGRHGNRKATAGKERGWNLQLDLGLRLLRLGALDLRNLLLEIALQEKSNKVLGGHGGRCHDGIWIRGLLLLLLNHSRNRSRLKLLLLLKIGVIYRVVAAVVIYSGSCHAVAAIKLLNNRTKLLQALL